MPSLLIFPTLTEAVNIILQIITNSAGRQTTLNRVVPPTAARGKHDSDNKALSTLLVDQCVNRLPYRLSMSLPPALGRLIMSSVGALPMKRLSSHLRHSVVEDNHHSERGGLWWTCSSILTTLLSNDVIAVRTLILDLIPHMSYLRVPFSLTDILSCSLCHN